MKYEPTGLVTLTVWQPWASLIIVGAKPYEFRSHKRCGPHIGKRIVIHAGVTQIDQEEIRDLIKVLERGGDCAAETCLHADKAMPVLEAALDSYARSERGPIDLKRHGSLPWGSGLGTAVLGTPRIGTDIAEEFGVPRANDSSRDQHANWGWPLSDIEQWDMPIPARGAQGMWPWTGVPLV